jgi:tyrosine-protein phosphatase SIW14
MRTLQYAAILFVVSWTLNSHASIENLFKVAEGVYRGGQPTELADYEKLRRLGIKTIISLRDDGAFEEQTANRYGFRFLLFPMSAWKTVDDAMVDRVLGAMINPTLGPIFIHCWRGKDRTGLIVALHRVLHEGWTPQKAYDEWVAFGLFRGFLQFRYYFYKKTRQVPQLGYRMLNPLVDLAAVGN